MNKIGIILGSGLNKFSEELNNKKVLYEDRIGIHHKKIISGKIKGKEIIIFEGRNHLYEKPSEDKLYFNVDKAKELGVTLLIVTNAAGGVNQLYDVSDLMIISSHISLLFNNIKYNKSDNIYDEKIIIKIISIASAQKIKLHKGVYCASLGPLYETKSEVEFYNKIDIDAVGMSTIPELIYANNLGIKTLAISCITNTLKNISDNPVNHSEVLVAGKKAFTNFSKLLKAFINDY